LHNPPANGKQGPIPGKISQTLLTWIKYRYTPLTLPGIKPTPSH
jgi:hypothetical protein